MIFPSPFKGIRRALIERDSYAKDKGAYLYYSTVKGVEVEENDRETEALLKEAEEYVKKNFTLESLKENPKGEGLQKVHVGFGDRPHKGQAGL